MRLQAMIAGLCLSATGLFAVVACDDDPARPELRPPRKIDWIKATPKGNTVTLTWTVPERHPLFAEASRYEARYWDRSDTVYSWDSAIPAGDMAAVAGPGEVASMTISDLPYNASLVFYVRAFDKAGNAYDGTRADVVITGLERIREIEVIDDARELEVDSDGNIYLLTRKDNFDPPTDKPGLTKLLPDGSVAWQWQPTTACDGYDATSTITLFVKHGRLYGVFLGWSCGIWRLDIDGRVQSEWMFPGTGLRADAITSKYSGGLRVVGAGRERGISEGGELISWYSRDLTWSPPNTYAVTGTKPGSNFLSLHAKCGENCVYGLMSTWGRFATCSCEPIPAAGELSAPQGIGLAPDGRVYLVDSNAAVGVQVFSHGEFVTRWEVFGGRDIAVAENGEVYVLAERPEDGARVVQVYGTE